MQSCNRMRRPASKERMKSPGPEIRESEVTPEALFLRRREFLRAAAAVSLVAAGCLPGDEGEAQSAAAPGLEPLANVKPAPAGAFRAMDELTAYESATAYQQLLRVRDEQGPGLRRPHPAAAYLVVSCGAPAVT